MENKTPQTETLQVGAEVQLANGKSVVDRSTEQETDAQASTGASPVRNKKVKSPKDFTPVYTDSEKARLDEVTKVCKQAILEAPEKYDGAVSFGSNCAVSLTRYKKNGGVFCTPVVNRSHGADQRTTGESIMTYGSQHPLMIITIQMATASGIAYERFANDKDTDKPIPDAALVLLDGNGRINYLLTIPDEKWPDVWGVFPSMDAAGYFNIPRAFDVINTKVSVWKTQDLVSKLIIMEGEETHEGWKKINDLVNHGYKYQAACQLVTLGSDRLKKNEVTPSNQADTFKYFDCSEKILVALKERFVDDSVLKTKALPMVVSTSWGKLRDLYGQNEATEDFVEFVKTLDDTTVLAIKNAKNTKGGPSKDEHRKNVFSEAFDSFLNTHKKNE